MSSSLIDKNDLCANTARIDLNSLIKLSEIAVFRSRCDVENSLSAIQHSMFHDSREKISCAFEAEGLASAAKDLHIGISMQYFLTEAKNREIQTIVK